MHDIRAIRNDPASFSAAMLRRGLQDASHPVMEQDALRRHATRLLQEKQAQRTELSKQVAAGRRSGVDTSDLETKAVSVRLELEILEEEAAKAETKIRRMLETLPNRLDPDVPDGPDESANVVLAQHGEPREFGFPPRQHFELGEALGMMDFARAAKISGARFTILHGPLARLERALGHFMLDLQTNVHGYTEMSVPLLVNDAAVYGTNQLPKFADDLFRTTDGRWLIPTAEVPLTNTVAGEILLHKQLPLRLTALTDCFRSEAGAAGRDTRGMMRQHQFRKVELVSVTHPEESVGEHERMTRCAEAVLMKLGLPFRRVLLSSGDTGFGAAKTFDLEVWLPGQQAWREISSCSNCRDFQARRMNARFRAPDGRSVAFVHTLNGSGVAVGRALISVIENYQQQDGSIAVPSALAPYMGGVEWIGRA